MLNHAQPCRCGDNDCDVCGWTAKPYSPVPVEPPTSEWCPGDPAPF